MVAASGGAARPQVEATAWNLLLEAVAGEVVEELRRAGYRSLLLKGVTLERWLYRDEPRPYSDVDILVDPASFDECERVLARLGFERSALERAFAKGRPSHASTWIRGSVPLDLHRTVVGLGVSPSGAWEALSADTETWVVGSREAAVPNVAARALLLTLHAAQHGPDFARTQDDLQRSLVLLSDTEWAEAGALARKVAAETPMAAGLAAVEGGRELCEKLGLKVAGTTAVEGSPAFHIAQGLVWFREMRGARAKTRYLGRKLFPPPSLMRSRVEWSRSGPAALAAAYLLRLAGLALHVPRGLWALAGLRSTASSKQAGRTERQENKIAMLVELRDALASTLRRTPPFRGKGRLGSALGHLLPVEHDVVAHLRDGSLMHLDLCASIERWTYWTGEYDTEMIARLSAALPPKGVVVDVGANIGLYTIPLGRRAQLLGGHVFAIEAMPANVERLRQNVEENLLSEVVTVFETAVGGASGTWLMRGEQSPGFTGNAARTLNPEGAVEVPVHAFDELAAELHIQRCDVVKVDIEGGEYDFLRGGEAFLRKHRPFIFIELNAPHMRRAGWSLDDLRRLLEAWEYDLTERAGGGEIEVAVLEPREL
jgi:FkbM family methyltransferase